MEIISDSEKIIDNDFSSRIRVFEDKNSNCLKESDEPWLSNYPVKINDINMRFQTDNSGQLYLHVDKNNYNLNAEEYLYYTPTCPDVVIQADEEAVADAISEVMDGAREAGVNAISLASEPK